MAEFVATSSVRDALALSAENHTEKGTCETALLLWLAAKWAVMTGIIDDQEPVYKGLLTLWYVVQGVRVGKEKVRRGGRRGGGRV